MTDALHRFQIVGDDTVGPVRIITITSEFAPFLAEGVRCASSVFVREADVTTYTHRVSWQSEQEALEGHTMIVEVTRAAVEAGCTTDQLGPTIDGALAVLSQRGQP